MTGVLALQAEWERTDGGSPEERACFAMLRIGTSAYSLTEGFDSHVNRLREGPLVSAYHVAEWLAWNWWRLRWEPRTSREGWAHAHRMSTIGDGYVWPNLTIQSDGSRVVLVPKPSVPTAKPFRFIADVPLVVPAVQFEAAVDAFITQVLDRLQVEKIAGTNLSRIWSDIRSERANAKEALRRKLEALLGAEPDEADPSVIDRLEAESEEVGGAAIEELAANQGVEGKVHTVAELRAVAASTGRQASLADAVKLRSALTLPRFDAVPGWLRGAEAAQALRAQENLGAAPISNNRLEAMAGVMRGLVIAPERYAGLSFALDQGDESRVVLRSKSEAGRRFNLARLLGDRICAPDGGSVKAATRSYTYRQKMQRSFAAEFLCPFEALEDWLKGDYSSDAMDDAAEYFSVSPRTIETLLVNHGRIDRAGLEAEGERFETTSAA